MRSEGDVPLSVEAALVGPRRTVDAGRKGAAGVHVAADASVGAGADVSTAVAVDVAHAQRQRVGEVGPAVVVGEQR